MFVLQVHEHEDFSKLDSKFAFSFAPIHVGQKYTFSNDENTVSLAYTVDIFGNLKRTDLVSIFNTNTYNVECRMNSSSNTKTIDYPADLDTYLEIV